MLSYIMYVNIHLLLQRWLYSLNIICFALILFLLRYFFFWNKISFWQIAWTTTVYVNIIEESCWIKNIVKWNTWTNNTMSHIPHLYIIIFELILIYYSQNFESNKSPAQEFCQTSTVMNPAYIYDFFPFCHKISNTGYFFFI